MKTNKKQLIFWIFITIILIIFLGLFNYFNIKNNYNLIVFNSPDETANYFFAVNFAKYNTLSVENNFSASRLIHPRSISVYQNKLIPTSFIGLALIYGSIAKIAGIWIIKYLTSIFAILGIVFFFLLIKKIYNRRIAFVSSILLAITPAYFYFANKIMMQNILFCSLLIMALYFFIDAIQKEHLYNWVLWAFCFGLSMMVRSSEFIWTFLIFFTIIIIKRKNIHIKKLILAIMIFILSISPVFYFNKINNGNAFKFSYIENLDPGVSSIGVEKQNYFTMISNYIFPFGIHIKNIAHVFYNFVLKLNWPFCILLFLSLIILFIKRNLLENKEKLYIYLWLFLSIYLIIYYGSLKITDDAIKNSITIGSSYIRYLLPFFIFSIPIIGFGLEKLAVMKKQITVFFVAFLVSMFCFWSYNIVYSKGVDSLENISKNIQEFKNLRNIIIQKTPENAIIFTNRSDKFIFPHRNVVYLNDENIIDYKHINEFKNIGLPLYYFDNLKNKIGSNNNIELNEIFNIGSYYLYSVNIK